jgi:hypothetical protein
MKTIFKLFSFILFALLLYGILIFVWGEFLPSYFNKNLILGNGKIFLHQKFKEVKNKKNIDVVFLGSSHCYRGFDPRIFKKNNIIGFNLGTSSQTPIQSEYLFSKYIVNLKPKFLLFEVNPMIFSLDGLESSLDIINSHSLDINLFEIGIKHRNVKAINSLIYRFMSGEIDENTTIIKHQDDDTYIQGGYIEKKTAFLKVKKIKNEIFKINNNQLIAFNRLLNKISKTNIKLILVQAPISKLLYNSYLGTEKFDSMMDSKGYYINFNKDLNLVDSLHFYDLDHLNQRGVEIFDNYLIKKLFSKHLK